MATIIGIRFKDVGKIYYFDPNDEKLNLGDLVIVETSRGIECGKVAIPNKEVPDSSLSSPLKKMIRKATPEDIKIIQNNHEKEKRAFEICAQKIKAHNLKMKLISAEYSFENNKILFYFSADGRVDFRDLVKDLAYMFKTRIELRQIGVRDETKMLGGLGICGRPYCCNTFLGDFQPVSIKMAKEQGLSLNPVKISGTCGRLMCCLKFEQDAYTELLKVTPKVGAIVETSDGRGTVEEVNLITGSLLIKLHKSPNASPRTFNVSDVKLIKDGQIKLERSEIEKLKKLEKD